MAIKASGIKQATRTIPVPYGDDAVQVTYRLGAVNRSFADWAREHGEEDDAAYQMMERLVESWDVVDDEGNAVPVTVESLLAWDFPLELVRAVIETVSTDAMPGKPS